MIKIIDTHTHLCDDAFDTDRKEVLTRAENAGVVSVLTVSETADDARKNLVLAAEHPVLKPLAGLYPSHLDVDDADSVITFIREHRDHLAGIGEVGLDYWIVKEEMQRDIQREIFTRFIDLSIALDLPLNVHSRSAGQAAIDLLLKTGAKRVQLHAFDGKASRVNKAVEAGYYFSIPPSIVRSRQKQKLVQALPLSGLLVETDSPVLGPEPGKRNEPAHTRIVVDSIAQIKGITPEAVAETTTKNAMHLYGSHIHPRPKSYSKESTGKAVWVTKENQSVP